MKQWWLNFEFGWLQVAELYSRQVQPKQVKTGDFGTRAQANLTPYPSREGLQSFYPQIPAHFQTWKLCPWAHIPPGRGTGVFIHGSLHISRHGNSICGPISLQGGAPEFLSTDPCTFLDMETLSMSLYPSREGHQSFYPQIPAHFWTWKLWQNIVFGK